MTIKRKWDRGKFDREREHRKIVSMKVNEYEIAQCAPLGISNKNSPLLHVKNSLRKVHS